MASSWFATIKSTSASRSVLILPVDGQKVKGIGPSPLEVLLRSRGPLDSGKISNNPAGASTTMLMIPDVDHLILPLGAHRHRHNIQTGGHYLALAISTIPRNGLFA